eukprot:3851910-Pyramimonas_sp.AAC.1
MSLRNSRSCNNSSPAPAYFTSALRSAVAPAPAGKGHPSAPRGSGAGAGGPGAPTTTSAMSARQQHLDDTGEQRDEHTRQQLEA